MFQVLYRFPNSFPHLYDRLISPGRIQNQLLIWMHRVFLKQQYHRGAPEFEPSFLLAPLYFTGLMIVGDAPYHQGAYFHHKHCLEMPAF